MQATVQESVSSEKRETSKWSSLSLIIIGGIMLTIGIVWRVIDQFILGLGDTWMNIMPSKLFPFLIIIGFFWKFRRSEIGSVLGLSKNQLRVQLSFGLLMGLLISFMIDVGGIVIYALFLDPAYPLELRTLNIELLGYMFLFFLTNSFLEESLFRGLLQNAFKTRFSPNRAIFLSALIFGFWHAGWPILNGGQVEEVMTQVFTIVFFTIILGLLFGIYYERFSSAQSLVGIIIAHTILNFVGECFKIGPEPVMQGPDIVMYNPGIMAVTFVLFFGTFLTLFIVLWRYKIEQISDLWHRLTDRMRMNVTSDSRTNA
ncbi:MAG: CPBP family intramembrane glutamic endopeptidase [Candidatus Thorarchaeota archaeon]